MASKLFISAKEVAKELEVFVVVKGKISRKYFEERVYGMNEMK